MASQAPCQGGIKAPMKSVQRLLLIATAVALIAVQAAAAGNAAGIWKGRIVVDFSKMQKTATAEQQKMINAQVEAVKKIAVTIVLKPNGTYTSSTTGLPGATKPKEDGGTWKQSGNKVTFTASKPTQGKPESQTLTMSSDGKGMVLDLPAGGGATAKLVLHR